MSRPSLAAGSPVEDRSATPAPRQCGRCRWWFDGDPDAHPTAKAEWWACDPCRASLLGVPRTTRAMP